LIRATGVGADGCGLNAISIAPSAFGPKATRNRPRFSVVDVYRGTRRWIAGTWVIFELTGMAVRRSLAAPDVQSRYQPFSGEKPMPAKKPRTEEQRARAREKQRLYRQTEKRRAKHREQQATLQKWKGLSPPPSKVAPGVAPRCNPRIQAAVRRTRPKLVKRDATLIINSILRI
jgi:hypothetical protein